MAVGQCPAGATGAGGERHLPDTDHLISQVDRHVARLRATRGQHDLALAERLAGCLRQLILDTASSCATDRARVRAAVRYFVLRRAARHDRLPIRSFAADQRVIGDIARQLGRHDVADTVTGRVDATDSPGRTVDAGTGPATGRADAATGRAEPSTPGPAPPTPRPPVRPARLRGGRRSAGRPEPTRRDGPTAGHADPGVSAYPSRP